MKGLSVRRTLLWLGIATGVVLGLFTIMAMPGASTWQSQGGDGQVIDMTKPDASATGPAPIVIVNSGIVTHNSEVVARGFGFDPFEDVLISLYTVSGEMESQIGLIQADKEGTFADAKFYVAHELASGEHLVVAVGQTSGAMGQASFRIQPSGPWLALDSYSEKPYSSYTFSAGGFDPSEEISLHFDSVSARAAGSIRADQYGGLTRATVRVPMLSPGEHSFILIGQQSRTAVSSPFTVLGFYPWVGLTSYSPQPEQSIGFIGHDFAPGERVSFFVNEMATRIAGSVTADENGNFATEGTFEVPVNAVGEMALIFFGETSQIPITVSLNVLPFGPLLELSTYAGPPGTKVSFNGQGYARNEVVRVYLGKVGGREISRFTSNGEGKFSGAGEFAIPFDVGAGKITLTAAGDNSRVPVALEFALLEVVPWAELSNYHAPTGTVITFNGNAFGLGEAVSIYVGSGRSQLIATALADESGAFAEAGPYVIPEDAKGKIGFTFVGEQTGATVTATFTVAEPPTGEGPPDEGEQP